MARDRYAVGGLQIVAGDLVNAVRVVFCRLQPEGALDQSDSYLSEWIGNPGSVTPVEISAGNSPVIGLCGRQGAVKNALALIVDDAPPKPANSPIAANPPAQKTARPPVDLAVQPSPPKSKQPVYVPPPGQPGTPTQLVGGPEGWQFQAFDKDRRPVVGFRFRMGRWAGTPAVARFDPLFDRQHPGRPDELAIGREGYVVGGLQVVAGELVNAVRIIFVREQSDGSLDKADFYLSDWIGDPGETRPQILGDGQTRVIGLCGRNGAVKNAIALILDKP
jgi:hypothetical protein